MFLIRKLKDRAVAMLAAGVIVGCFTVVAPAGLSGSALTAAVGGGDCCAVNSAETDCNFAKCGKKHNCVNYSGANQNKCEPKDYCGGTGCPATESLTNCVAASATPAQRAHGVPWRSPPAFSVVPWLGRWMGIQNTKEVVMLRISQLKNRLGAMLAAGVIVGCFTVVAPAGLSGSALTAAVGGGDLAVNSAETDCNFAKCGKKHNCVNYSGANQNKCEPKDYCGGTGCPATESLTNCVAPLGNPTATRSRGAVAFATSVQTKASAGRIAAEALVCQKGGPRDDGACA